MRAKELKAVPLFASCGEAELERLLLAPHRLVAYGEGQVVMRRGEACLSLMVLVGGEVESRIGGGGQEVMVERFVAPRLLAPMFLFARDNAMPVEVRAMGKAEVLFINRDAFFDFMRLQPGVMRAFLGLLSERGRFLSDKVRSFATKDLRGRVAEYMGLYGGIGAVRVAAEQLGVSRPSLSRVLAKMLAEGTVEKKDGKIYTLTKK